MSGFENCPSCGASMQGAPIPKENQDLYGGETHFSRLIGIEYNYDHPDQYDGVSEWRCPDCGYRQGRWSGKALAENESEPRYGERRTHERAG